MSTATSRRGVPVPAALRRDRDADDARGRARRGRCRAPRPRAPARGERARLRRPPRSPGTGPNGRGPGPAPSRVSGSTRSERSRTRRARRAGCGRPATTSWARLVEWFQRFQADIGEAVGDATEVVRRRLAAGQLWVWDDSGPVAMAGRFDAVAGVARIGPGLHAARPARSRLRVRARRRGLVMRCSTPGTAASSTRTSRTRRRTRSTAAIGYRAVAEALRYRFDDRALSKPAAG